MDIKASEIQDCAKEGLDHVVQLKFGISFCQIETQIHWSISYCGRSWSRHILILRCIWTSYLETN